MILHRTVARAGSEQVPQVLFGVKTHLDCSAATIQAKFYSNFRGGGGNPESLLQLEPAA